MKLSRLVCPPAIHPHDGTHWLGADVAMLDNFSPSDLKRDANALKEKYPHVIFEASGGVTLDTLADYFCDGVSVVRLLTRPLCVRSRLTPSDFYGFSYSVCATH